MTDRTLEDRIDAGYADAWRPAEGDILLGYVSELGIGNSKYGDYPILTVQTADGALAVHAFHTVLRDKLLELEPSIGEQIAIKYLGRKLPRNADKGATLADDGYESYHVIIDRGTVDVWGKLRTIPGIRDTAADDK